MKKPLLIISALVLTTSVFAQQQIANSDLENWETVSGGQEPVDWNGFLTASGTWSGLGADQLQPSTDVRPGSSGTTSARIWSRNAGFGIVAQGNMTIGRINMGSTTPSDGDNNYNYTITTDTDFSQALTESPDSIVFWAKYTAASGSSTARMKATLHDDFDYHDPEASSGSVDHAHAYAELDYSPTNGWMRFAVPFNYNGLASTHSYILVTFASNSVPGGGAVDDEVIIDDIELIYNVDNVSEVNSLNASVSFNSNAQAIAISSDNMNGDFEIFDIAGNKISEGPIKNEVPFNEPAGMYFVVLNIDGNAHSFKVIK